MTRRLLLVGAVAALGGGGAAGAQERGATPDPAPAVELRAGRWDYESTVEGPDGDRRRLGTRVVTVAAAEWRGVPAWLLVDVQASGRTRALDSIHVARAGLASLRRATRLAGPSGEATLSAEFTADSVRGGVTVDGETRPIAAANVPGAISGDATVLAVLGALPLRVGLVDTLVVFGPDAGTAATLQLVVLSATRVRVPAGTFDSWVVHATAGAAEATYYVAKGGPVVLVRARVPSPAAGVVETALARRPGRR